MHANLAFSIHKLGSVNLSETFRRISEVWGNAQKCLIYLSSITSHMMVFD